MMRFWTAFQEPLTQAALVENGKVIRTIPNHPPKTPARFVYVVGEYQDKLILTRSADHQIWSLDGKTFEQLYTPYVYAPHWVGEFAGLILAISSDLDVVYLMDLNCKIKAEWWLHSLQDPRFQNDFSQRVKQADYGDYDWLDFQLNRCLPEENLAGHLNSVYRGASGELIVTVMRMQAGVIIPNLLQIPNPLDLNIVTTQYECPHDIQFDERTGCLVYGSKEGLVVNEKVVLSCPFVKRVKQIGGGYIITHESGVSVTDMDGKEKEFIKLPRPFGVFHLEM
jgi:hypothetical protein